VAPGQVAETLACDRSSLQWTHRLISIPAALQNQCQGVIVQQEQHAGTAAQAFTSYMACREIVQQNSFVLIPGNHCAAKKISCRLVTQASTRVARDLE
jgi:hypothetical protein